MRCLYEVRVNYTDGTSEVLLLHGVNPAEAEAEAEAWVDFKKVVRSISAMGECRHQRGGRAGGRRG